MPVISAMWRRRWEDPNPRPAEAKKKTKKPEK
jgi:hypothetical protein